MTPQEFVNAVRLAVFDSAVRGTIQGLESPPGRSPRSDLMALSRWYGELTDTDREKVGNVVHMAADLAVFSFLAVLDGAAAIEPAGPKGRLELRYRGPDGAVTDLNSEQDEDLHDLFNALKAPSASWLD